MPTEVVSSFLLVFPDFPSSLSLVYCELMIGETNDRSVRVGRGVFIDNKNKCRQEFLPTINNAKNKIQ